jgi:hypothetical protein
MDAFSDSGILAMDDVTDASEEGANEVQPPLLLIEPVEIVPMPNFD